MPYVNADFIQHQFVRENVQGVSIFALRGVDMQGVSLLTASSIDIRVDPSSPSYNVFKCLTVRHMISLQNAENLKQIFPEKEYWGLSPNFHIHVSVSQLYIPTMGLPFLLEEIYRPILEIAHRNMNVEIVAEAALFPEKEYINGIAVAV
jgi:hypothetical protein